MKNINRDPRISPEWVKAQVSKLKALCSNNGSAPLPQNIDPQDIAAIEATDDDGKAIIHYHSDDCQPRACDLAPYSLGYLVNASGQDYVMGHMPTEGGMRALAINQAHISSATIRFDVITVHMIDQTAYDVRFAQSFVSALREFGITCTDEQQHRLFSGRAPYPLQPPSPPAQN